MAAVVRSIKLPNGETITIRVPEEWGADEVRSQLAGTAEYGSLFAAPEAEDNTPAADEGILETLTPDETTAEALATGAGQGVTLGFGEELSAIGGGLGQLFNGGDFWSGYDRSLNRQRENLAELRESNPGAMLTGELVGGALTGGVGAERALASQALQKAPRLGALVGVGAAEGGLAGAGFADEDKVKGAAIGTAAGALFGAAGRGLEKGVEKILAKKAASKAQFDKDLDDLGATVGAKLDKDAADTLFNEVQGINKPAASSVVQVEGAAGVTKPLTKKQHRQKAQELAKTFKDEAGMADFQKRNVDTELDFRAKESEFIEQTPIELRKLVRQDRPASPMERQTAAMNAARKHVDEAQAKVETKPAAKEATVVRDRANANQAASDNVARNQDGVMGAFWRVGSSVISNVESMSPRLGMALRRATRETATETVDAVDKIDGFYKSPEYSKLSRKDRDSLEQAFWEGDGKAAHAVMGKSPGLREIFNENIFKLTRDIHARGRLGKGGIKGFEGFFIPRAVKNVRKLRARLGREQKQLLRRHIEKREKDIGRKLDEDELAGVYTQALTGRRLGDDFSRRVETIDPKIRRQSYENSRDALIGYAHRHAENRAVQKFFKNTLDADTPYGSPGDENAIGSVVGNLVEKGEMNPNDLDQMARSLSGIFGIGRKGSAAGIRRTKDVLTASTIGINPRSTIQQMADLAPVMTRMGVRDTVGALVGKKRLTSYDVGVREVAKDMRTAHGTAKLVRRSLQAMGFDKLDRLMANTAVNASLRSMTRKAKTNATKLYSEMEPLFGADDARKLVDDLADNRITPDVKSLVLWDVGKIRPVAREDMPITFLENPNGRLMYSLLSWTIKQLDFAKNSGLKKIRDGKVFEGTKELATLFGMMGLLNVPVDAARDLMVGREIDPASAMVQGMLGLGMSGKFMVDALSRGSGEEALASTLPVFGIAAGAAEGLWKFGETLDPKELINAAPAGRTGLQMWESLFGTGMEDNFATKFGNVLVEPAGAAELPEGTQPSKEYANLKKWENEPMDGRTKDGVWFPHESIEGADPKTPKGYLLQEGYDTVGYGHKIKPREAVSGIIKIGDENVRWKEGLSDEQVNTLFMQDTAKARTAIEKLVKVPLTDNQKEALVSLAYNAGIESFAGSNALRNLNKGDLDGFLDEAFSRDKGWTKAYNPEKGVKEVHDGLYLRRQREKALFLAEPQIQGRAELFKREAEAQLQDAIRREEEDREQAQFEQMLMELF